MIISKDDMAYVKRAVAAAACVDIESIIVEPGKVRAVDTNGTVLILHSTDVPDFEFGSIGVSRIPTFSSLVNTASSKDNLEVTATTEKMNGVSYIRSLTMKSKGSKIDYRCANPATIRAPKALNGADDAFIVVVDPDAIGYLAKGKAALGADEVTFNYKDGVLQFELSNINGDKFTQVLSENVVELNPTLKTFSYKYPLKLISTTLNPSVATKLAITSRGMCHVVVHGFDTFILPRN